MGKGDRKSKRGKIWRKSYGKRRKRKQKNEIFNVGILAFGSLIDNHGSELNPFVIKRIQNIETPFNIEYGRKSSERGNAPTLIPVLDGGIKVKATLLILSNKLPIGEAKNMLYRRETNKVGSDIVYKERKNPTPNQLVIGEHNQIKNVKIALTANFGSNLKEITADVLSDLAIESYNSNEVEFGRDGITYLFNNIKNGIITPLTEEYRNLILQKMNVNSLDEILKKKTV